MGYAYCSSPTCRYNPASHPDASSVHGSSPTNLYSWSGLSRRFANVPQASPAFREASQAAHQARSANDRLSQDAPSSNRCRSRLPSDDSDSDDQPLAQRRRRRAPHPVSDSGPSSTPFPSPPIAVTSPPPPVVTPPSVSSQANVPPDPPTIPVEPLTAQPSPPAQPPIQPSMSPQQQSTEVDPSRGSPPATSPPEPSPVPPSASPGSAAGPSSFAAGPSQPPPPVPLYYRITAPLEAGLQSRRDVPTSSLTMKGRLAIVWEESKRQMELLSPLAQMDRFSELYIKASHALRVEIKVLTKKKNSLEVSLTIGDQKLKDLREQKSQVEVVHHQLMDQQALQHQRALDQMAQKLRTAETLTQEQDKKLKSQEAQLTSQEAELLAARNELSQAWATAKGASTALAIYKEGENDRCQ
ncbi:formin-like protein 5 [Zingiber officinale]|uniref:formin-like protein 5 n=1 Tax=Zingiber officinale TaxID=94328 RepID=UPI001C4ACE9E|nr:formin-like protein 5 [Zingiber officinale]